jgi:hypothetical protein
MAINCSEASHYSLPSAFVVNNSAATLPVDAFVAKVREEFPSPVYCSGCGLRYCATGFSWAGKSIPTVTWGNLAHESPERVIAEAKQQLVQLSQTQEFAPCQKCITMLPLLIN